jgi:hypothetical protein
MATWLNLFKNDKKTEEDNQPLYRNVKVVFENDVNLTAGIPYEVALWKKDKTKDNRVVDMVSIKIEPNAFLMNEGEIKTEKSEDIPF